MINCTVTVQTGIDVLDSGHRAESQPAPTVLYQGPAYFSAPSTGKRQHVAWEENKSGSIHIHGAVTLLDATSIVISNHPASGAYEVTSVTHMGSEWRLDLGARANG